MPPYKTRACSTRIPNFIHFNFIHHEGGWCRLYKDQRGRCLTSGAVPYHSGQNVYQYYLDTSWSNRHHLVDLNELKYRVDAPALKEEGSVEKDDTTLIKFKLK